VNALLVMSDFLTALQFKELLAEKDFSRFERATDQQECAALFEMHHPDLVVIETDDSPVQPSWLIGLCLERGTPVLALTSDEAAQSSDPTVVILHKPFLKQQVRIAIEDALSRGHHGVSVRDGVSPHQKAH
jgi:AmiR/NasT family two-component response regulator